MADGYWRMAEKPAATLLHCGPGLANGLANLHNARRARSGIVNLVGDHATYHRPFDPPPAARPPRAPRAGRGAVSSTSWATPRPTTGLSTRRWPPTPRRWHARCPAGS